MDMNEDSIQQSTSSQPIHTRTRIIAPIDDAHPFDLEGYIIQVCSSSHLLIFSFHAGCTAIDRLTHIIATCPSIAPEAFHIAVQHIHQLWDPSLYQQVLSAYESLAMVPDLHLPNPWMWLRLIHGGQMR
jgi:COP9 signalosome complex subunit 1